MRAVIDTCVIVDALQSREPFCKDAQSIFLLCANRHIFHSFVAWQQQGNHPGQQQNARRCARKDHPPVRQARFAI